MSPSSLPPLPLPPHVEQQLRLGIDAVNLLREVVAETRDEGFDRPWLPGALLEQIDSLLLSADAVL
jgi:hypothetical protein